MPKDQGTISNRTETSLRESTVHWLADVWFGNDKEGVTKARRLVNVAEFTPAGIPIWANDITNLLKQGQYTEAASVAALGLLPGRGKGVKGSHISKYDFDKFKWGTKRAGGAGAEFEGPGTYIAEEKSPSLELLYQPLMTELSAKNKRIAHDKRFKSLDKYAFENEVYNELNTRPELKDYSPILSDMAESITTSILVGKPVEPQFRKFSKETAKLRDKYLNEITGLYNIDVKRPLRYDVNLNADPNQIVRRDTPIDLQPEPTRNKLMDLLDNSWLKEHEIQTSKSGITDLPYITQMTSPFEGSKMQYAYGPTYKDAFTNLMEQLNEYMIEQPVNAITDYYGDTARDMYRINDIPAVSYNDYEVQRLGIPEKYDNYVVFDDDLLDILKKTQLGIAPVAAGPMLAIDEEPKQKKKDKRDGK